MGAGLFLFIFYGGKIFWNSNMIKKLSERKSPKESEGRVVSTMKHNRIIPAMGDQFGWWSSKMKLKGG
jgi:hypothetical protein